MISPRHLVNWIVVVCYIQYMFTPVGLFNIPILDSIIPQVDDFLILVLFFLIAVSRIMRGNYSIPRNHFNWFVTLLIILYLVSSFINQVPLTAVLLSFKSYFIYVIFFYCITQLHYSSGQIRRLLRLVFFCFIAQLPIIAIQFLVAISNGTLSDDTGFGTFPGANNLSYSVIFPLLFVTYSYFVQGQKKYKWYFWLLALVLVLPVGEYAIAFYAFCLFLLFAKTFIKSKKAFMRTVFVASTMLLCISIFSAFKGSKSSTNRSLLTTINPLFLYSWLSQTQNQVHSGSQRNLYFPLTYFNLEKYSKSPWIGFGPGMYASNTAFRLMPEPNNLVYDAFHQIKLGMDPDVDSEIIPIWGEFGYVGIIVFIGFLAYSFLFFYNEHKKTQDLQQKAFTFVSTAGTLFLLVGFYVNHMWEIQTIFGTLMIFYGLSSLRRTELRKQSPTTTEPLTNV